MNLDEALTKAVREIVAEARASMPPGSPGFQARVTVLNPLTVVWQGKAIAHLPRSSSYTPQVGDQVAVLLFGTDPVVAFAITPAN